MNKKKMNNINFQNKKIKDNSLKDERGVALLVVLIFIMLLAVLVVEFSYETQVEASLVENRSNELQVYLAAKSGVAAGISL